MSATRFEAGDEVRCIDASNFGDEFLTVGSVYTIGAPDRWGQYLIEGVDRSWHGSRFEPVTRELPGSFDGVHPRLGAPEPEPTRPEWVRLTRATLGHRSGAVVKIADWYIGNPAIPRGEADARTGSVTRLLDGEWEPAEAPEPTVLVELPAAIVRRAAADDGAALVGPQIAEACRAALEVEP